MYTLLTPPRAYSKHDPSSPPFHPTIFGPPPSPATLMFQQEQAAGGGGGGGGDCDRDHDRDRDRDRDRALRGRLRMDTGRGGGVSSHITTTTFATFATITTLSTSSLAHHDESCGHRPSWRYCAHPPSRSICVPHRIHYTAHTWHVPLPLATSILHLPSILPFTEPRNHISELLHHLAYPRHGIQ
ncbi:hypothetical protein BS50DRAFT_576693 [Corynespora cassiicola Philippines]|uniref:Uncharacterized protein n=1 Tax=Corynespora cassiicola Philippines TaxID=1448308 RepID=A0A2T2NF59_CORCC|nr:hypothetical protein BS50DRAFT_576693 [Corynespora cassiicola Philippines]